MSVALKLGFTPFARPRGVLIVFCEENLQLGPATQRALAPIGDLLRRAAGETRGQFFCRSARFEIAVLIRKPNDAVSVRYV